MKTALRDSQAIAVWASEFNGVFTVFDLRNLLAASSEVDLFRRIRRLESGGVLRRFCRGIYVTGTFSLEAVSCRINPESYISCGTILSRNMIIGSVPRYSVTAVKPGRNREYANDFGSVIQLGIDPRLIFGVEFKQGIRRADSEKAYLDTLYFYQKGRRFSFDVYSDVNTGLLDKKKVRRYLKAYRNPKFVRFVENCIDA